MNIEDSIINIKPTETHIIQINDNRYKQLQSIWENNIDLVGSDEDNFDAEELVSFLINYFYITQHMMGTGMSYRDAFNELMFGKEE